MTGAGLILCLSLVTVLCGCERTAPSSKLQAPGPLGQDSPKEPGAWSLELGAGSRGPLFRDVSTTAGLRFTLGHGGRSPLTILETLGHGAGFVDVDGDGWLDLVLVGPDKVALYRNKQDGTFADVTEGSGLRVRGYWQGVASGDYDNDGRVDLFLTGYRCCALYHNEGGMRFREVTRAAGVTEKFWSSSASFVDIDHDGRLDLFVTNYVRFFPSSPQFCRNSRGTLSTCGPTTYDPEKPILYWNQGNGRFVDETARRGLANAHGNALGAAIADYDGDGWIDIAVANDQLPGDLFRNRGRGMFENVGVAGGTAFNVKGEEYAGMGIDWADYDANGSLELLVTTYQHQPTSLFAQSAPGLFSDICYTAGIAHPTMNYVGFGAKFFDYDNDGLADLAIANGHPVDTIASTDLTTSYAQPTQLFHNAGGGRLVEVTAEAGPDFTRPIVGRGLATGDYDNDGRVDLLVVDAEGRPLLLHNEVAPRNHWLSLQLRGVRSNRSGIGAHLTVEAGGRKWRQVVTTDGSFQSAGDARAHLGLGAATRADRIRIDWPTAPSVNSGSAQTLLENVAADQFLTVIEGERRAPSAERSTDAFQRGARRSALGAGAKRP